MAPILDRLTLDLSAWWRTLRPENSACGLRRAQSFVTRYSAASGETHLTRHVDGPTVDASLILQLHSPKGFSGGGISVWDQGVHFYQLRAGDLCLLDHLVWHQSHAVTAGERWVLVVFCQREDASDPINTSGAWGTSAARCHKAVSLASRAEDIDAATCHMLMQMLRTGGEELERAAFAMGCLACNSGPNRRLLADSGAVQLLVDLLRQMAKERCTVARAWVVAALGRLACDSENKCLIANAGAITVLVDLIQAGQDTEEAASALCNLAANHEANKDAIADHAGALVQLLSEAPARVWAATALANLASGAGAARRRAVLRRSGAKGALRRVLREGDCREHRRAEVALAELESESEES